MESASEETLILSVEEICREKLSQERCLSIIVKLLLSESGDVASDWVDDVCTLLSRYRLMVSSVLLSTLPRPFLGMRLSLEKLNNSFSILIYPFLNQSF